jgi:hypothetical protein
MKFERIERKDGIVTIITENEKWYRFSDGKILPSSTFITGTGCPKGIGFYKWLAGMGWDEAELKRDSEGAKGSKIHAAAERLLRGDKIDFGTEVLNPRSGQMEALTSEEYRWLMNIHAWALEYKPVVLGQEIVVRNDGVGYAGTLDLLCTIGGVAWIVDFKKSKDIYAEQKAQISSYGHGNTGEGVSFCDLYPNLKYGILQYNYPRTKKGWKFTEVADSFHLFLAAYEFWKEEGDTNPPREIELPESIQIKKEIP